MKTLRRFIKEAFDKGGVLMIGLSCLLLYKHQYGPHILGPLSYGIISVGFIGFARYIIMDYDSTAGSEDYQKLLTMLDQRKSEIDANRDKLEELRAACESFMAMREILEGWRRDPSLVQDKVTILEELLKKRDCGTSMLASKAGSTQGTVSDMATEQGSSPPSHKKTDTDDVREAMAQNKELSTPGEDMSEDKLEEIFHKLRDEVLRDLLDEVTDEVLEEESEKVLENISGDVQKQIYRRMQAEIPENAEWEISDKHMEQIMEKVQKELFEGLQESEDEISEEPFEILQKDMIEDEELITLAQEKSNPAGKEISEPKKDKEMATDDQEEMCEKGKERIQSEEESKISLHEKFGSLKDIECQGTLPHTQGNTGEMLNEQNIRQMPPVKSQQTEHGGQEQLEREIAEALLELQPETESNT